MNIWVSTKWAKARRWNTAVKAIDPSFDCDVYKSTDDAGEFTYFFLRDDTMEETYHIEFRYGSDLEQLQGYFVGDYAYWLSAGIDMDASEETIHKVIDLFITENLSGDSAGEAFAAALERRRTPIRSKPPLSWPLSATA